MIYVKCKCGKRLGVDERLAGKTGRCHYCGASVHIPAPGEAARAERTEAAPVAEALHGHTDELAVKPPPAGSGRLGMIILGALVLITLVVPWRRDADGGWVMGWRILASAGSGGWALLLAGSWAAGAGAVLSGALLRGLALAVARFALGAGWGALLLVISVEPESLPLGDVLLLNVERPLLWLRLAGVGVLMLAVVTGVRLRLGPSLLVRLLQLLAGLGVAALLIAPLAANLRAAVETARNITEAFDKITTYDRLAAALFLLALAAAGLMATVHALFGRLWGDALSPGSVNTLRLTLIGIASYALGRTIFATGSALGSLRVLYVAILLGAPAVLFITGVAGIICEPVERRRARRAGVGGKTGDSV